MLSANRACLQAASGRTYPVWKVGHTYGPHDGGVHDALLPARLHHSSLQAGDDITNMELNDTLQLVGRPIQCTGCSCIFAASGVLLNLSNAQHKLLLHQPAAQGSIGCGNTTGRAGLRATRRQLPERNTSPRLDMSTAPYNTPSPSWLLHCSHSG